MERPYNSRRRVSYWDRRGTGEMVDAEQWLQYLPYNDDGEILLTKELAIDLALLHSREFQQQVEQLYLQALALSQSRFAFEVNWAGGTGTSFAASGAEGVPRDINNSSSLSASRNFAAGGQLIVDFLNSVSYQVGGGQANFATGNMLFRLTQPLLRNAFRNVRTEGLTQAERNLLYSVRDFARFRRQFYLRIVQQYLQLLSQSQRIRIEEENIRNLDFNLELHETLYRQGAVSQIQVDQIFQSKQSGRISLIGERQSLQAALDQFKFELGLPAKVNIKLDESLLDPFKLNSDQIEKLRQEGNDLEASLRKPEYIPPNEAPKSFLEDAYTTLGELNEKAGSLLSSVKEELEQWRQSIEEKSKRGSLDVDARLELEFQQSTVSRAATTLQKLEDRFRKSTEKIAEGRREMRKLLETGVDGDDKVEKPRPEETADGDELSPQVLDDEDSIVRLAQRQLTSERTPKVKAFDQLVDLISKNLQADISELFVTQTQIRLFLIGINPVEVDEPVAVDLALSQRLDLMNDRARVVDAYRRVEVAADQLESDLNLTATADLRTAPNRDNGIRFDGESSRYTAGIQLDGALNRMAERNAYRSSQIAYQQQRRSYMASEDSIVNQVRGDLRQLIQSKFNFQTTRQQLIVAAR
jgi:outer membrane protein TolC